MNPANPTLKVPVASAPYPNDADQIIRMASELVFYTDPLHLLDLIRDRLFGDADKVVEMAHRWAENTVIPQTKVGLQTTKDVLGSYWQGPAYTQFNAYVGNVIGNLDANQAVMTNIATTLGNCAQVVQSTYASAIKLIGQCAGDLLNLGVLGASLFVPGVDLITGPALLLKAMDKLDDFVKNVATLLADAGNQIASYRSSGISFAANANAFKVPEPIGDSNSGAVIGSANDWHVIPNK
ncbi:WXG100 family type VII secretion target [Kutzneria sp. CA-103260]|uniref:WXG100 family type VII secretion target n=1 Tax=Kutzneria sp. CA-103260 TaxID=2802641 RepID=UPI001BADC947|nr:hypothetical protein [Kutzneria sp. CA-103260]QUQ65291.1 hypothetical protein JJ691_30140 [Kutzneria sp. CA-103260]